MSVRRPSVALRALTLLAALAAAGASARAQGPAAQTSDPRLAAARPADVATQPGRTVTSAIRLTNLSAQSLDVRPQVRVPAEWGTVLGTVPFTLAPRDGDVWLVSVRVPSNAPAGRYAVQLRASDRADATLVRDSVMVVVGARHAIALTVAERPAYSISGASYRTLVLAQNDGNVASTFRLRATSSLDSPLDLPLSVSLDAGESRMLRVDVTSTTPGLEARDDVLELYAVDAADTSASAKASTHVTIVQRAGAGADLHTVSSTLRIRAAGSNAGVSPFELVGGGALRDGGSEQIDFTLRGRAPSYSPFGDREEYRMGITGRSFRLQAGDALYSASPLLSAGQRGFGGGFDVGDSTFGGGAFAQQFRFLAGQGSEQGGFVRFGGDESAGAPRFGLSAVNRAGGPFDGQAFGASARLHPIGDMVVDLEYADSRGATGHGVARSARMSGGSLLHFDLGHRDVDPTFAGISRGTMYDYASLSTESWNALQLSASAARSVTRGTIIGFDFQQQMRSALVELSYDSHLSVGVTAMSRGSQSSIVADESQRGLLARADQSVGLMRFWSSAELGRARDGSRVGPHPYHQLTLGMSAPVGVSTFSLYGEESRGELMMRGADQVLTIGGDAQVRVASHTTVALGGSATRSSNPADFGFGANSYTQVDARLTHELSSGASIGMRVRIGGSDFLDAAANQRLAYLEYSMPLQLPIGPSRKPGRVRGRVVDEQTGRGVAGALVRLGPQAAITDADGRVAFAGLPAGAYRVALAQQLASGSTLFTGNPNVLVDEERRAPARFSVAVEPAGSIGGSVRRVILARTGVGASADSLADGGPLEGVSVALAGARDTVYRTTDASGTFTFTDVPSGSWTLIVVSGTPDQTTWELERIPVVMSAGEHKSVTFRLVPKRRKVKIVGGDGFDERTLR